jgi:hypothetical protein
MLFNGKTRQNLTSFQFIKVSIDRLYIFNFFISKTLCFAYDL